MKFYQYPKTINSDSNASRSLTFVVYNQAGLVKSVADAMIDAKNKMMSLLERTKSPDGNISEMLGNLTSNERASSGDESIIASITLPLPNTFNDTQNHGWNEQKSLIGDIGTNIANKNIADTSLTEVAGLAAGAYEGFKSGGGVGDIVSGALIGGLVGKAARSSNISADSILANMANASGQRKPIIDPSYFQNYTGSSGRSFTLQYDLVPNSVEEAEAILMIIAKFKQYSSPTQISGSPMISAPYRFKITNDNSFINLLTAIDTVVLTSLSVNYGADGSMEMFGDGMPKHIGLTLTFAENRVRTSQDFDTKPNTSTLGSK